MNEKEIFMEAIEEEIESLKEIKGLVSGKEEEEMRKVIKRVIRHDLRENKQSVILLIKHKGE